MGKYTFSTQNKDAVHSYIVTESSIYLIGYITILFKCFLHRNVEKYNDITKTPFLQIFGHMAFIKQKAFAW